MVFKETQALAKVLEAIKRNPHGVTQKTLSLEIGLSQSQCSRSLSALTKHGAIKAHKSQPGPNGLPGPTIYKYNSEWVGFDIPLKRECYGFELVYNGKTFDLENGFHRLVTHKGAHDYLQLTGNFRSALANDMIFYLGSDLLSESEPDWDAYRSALQLALAFINTQSLNGSFESTSSDAITFRKAAGYYA